MTPLLDKWWFSQADNSSVCIYIYIFLSNHSPNPCSEQCLLFLCLWAILFLHPLCLHMNLMWVTTDGWRNIWCRLTKASVIPRAALSTIVSYHHQVWRVWTVACLYSHWLVWYSSWMSCHIREKKTFWIFCIMYFDYFDWKSGFYQYDLRSCSN